MFVLLLPAAALALVGYGVLWAIDRADSARKHHAARTHQ
jgi:hypothetical protein